MIGRLTGRIVQRAGSDVLRTRRVDLRREGLELGLRIVLASDLHARDDWYPQACIAAAVDAINDVPDADLVALVGDFVGHEIEPIEWSAREYARIEAPTYGVLGNHDHWTDPDLVTRALEAAGVELLTNRATALAPDTWLAGLDSCWPGPHRTTRPDPEAAFADVPENASCIVLGHEPWLATLHEHDLHLAGHTHCGQVRLPLGRLGDRLGQLHMPRYSTPYAARLHRVRRADGSRRLVYTTAGVGFSTIALRVFCPPEIVVIDC